MEIIKVVFKKLERMTSNVYFLEVKYNSVYTKLLIVMHSESDNHMSHAKYYILTEWTL